ncbi:NAD(P)/FAD-dependent oxidoreductase [Planctomicrobium piriforme]|uniref:NADH:ubiquinone reductase (non-electrogenic) n=1 Tax=Planctomicrobium piriforme TaxID=1576369 RepID=A0A1I3E397_9PLAN|nr:NAD(P)/FAD-dependent oxidoreductase [Planctomicrobium piriforme]SFH93171.1 NADH dehydrogenase [Planctomicrobium piriforme]
MTRTPMFSQQHQVVVIGGGFGGLHAVQGLRRAPVEVKLIDKRNFHLFQPLLYQVASGALSPANIAAPLRQILSRQANCQVMMGEVVGIDAVHRRVDLTDGEVHYDTLVLAAGATHSYFGNDHWGHLAPGLKTVEDATEMRARILTAFEWAELETDSEIRRRLLTFVIVGAGPTGVELAGALAEISHRSLKDDFRTIDPAESQIMLVEAADRVLTPFPPALSAKAQASLERLGVTVRCKTSVADVAADHVVLKFDGQTEVVPTQTVLWAAGVRASPLAKIVAASTGAQMDRAGRVIVERDLSLPGFPEIFVIGDMANYGHHGERPLPGVAPVAIQEGQFVARLIDSRVREKPAPVFKYHDRGNLATIGRWSAVADFQWLQMSGFFAWVLWLVVHLLNIISFRNRVLVLIQWGWNFLSSDRSARLITGEYRPPDVSYLGRIPPDQEVAPAGRIEGSGRIENAAAKE